MNTTTSALLDGVAYPRNKVYAPCFGTHHDHSRAIATCNTCGREVVIYKGRVLNVTPNSRGARQFTCWADSHQCVDPNGADAQALTAAYDTAKSALRTRVDEFHAKFAAHGLTEQEQIAALEELSDLKIAVSVAGAAARDAGLEWVGWEA